MDVLSDVLNVVRSGATFCRAECSAPWAVDWPDPGLLASLGAPEAECWALFHLLIDGACLVEVKDRPAVALEAGDALFFPQGASHTMRSADGLRRTPAAVLSQGSPHALPQVSFGGGGPKSRLICGHLNCDARFQPLADALPAVMVIRRRDDYRTVEAAGGHALRPTLLPRASAAWMGTTLEFAIDEASNGRPGNAAMLGRLIELMFVELLREHLQQLPAERAGWLAALKDARVGKALGLLHAQPARDWTVDDLARRVALSRSALAQRFTSLVGATPMRYLATWRVQLAKQMLRDGGQSMQEVATRVGYRSEAAFNRAFKRASGTPPAAWRRARLGEPVPPARTASSRTRIQLS
jgi:AraC-like DNA-binding protein